MQKIMPGLMQDHPLVFPVTHPPCRPHHEWPGFWQPAPPFCLRSSPVGDNDWLGCCCRAVTERLSCGGCNPAFPVAPNEPSATTHNLDLSISRMISATQRPLRDHSETTGGPFLNGWIRAGDGTHPHAEIPVNSHPLLGSVLCDGW